MLVRTPAGAQVPIAQIADLHTVEGPSMVRNENGLLSGYVYVDTGESDIGVSSSARRRRWRRR